MGSPPCDVWFRFKRVPLHVWREETFSLLGKCMGSLIEVDPFTYRKDNLLFGRVKVARDPNQKLPHKLNLWLDDLCVPIEVGVGKGR